MLVNCWLCNTFLIIIHKICNSETLMIEQRNWSVKGTYGTTATSKTNKLERHALNSISPTCTTCFLYYKKSWHFLFLFLFLFLQGIKIPGWRRTPWGGGQRNRHTCVNDISVGSKNMCKRSGSVFLNPRTTVRSCWENNHLPFPLHCCHSSPKTNPSTHPPNYPPFLNPLVPWLDQSLHLSMTQTIGNHTTFFFFFFFFSKLHVAQWRKEYSSFSCFIRGFTIIGAGEVCHLLFFIIQHRGWAAVCAIL